MIELKDIYKSFGDKQVLKDFSVCLDTGLYCLMGDSGAGKTTLLRIIAGLLQADSGQITGTSGKRINMVFQENRLIEGLSAVKNIAVTCPKSVSKADIIELLTKLGLQDSLYCPVETLSGGMKRRVALARALIVKADIYLFDEPFKGIDEERKGSIIELLKKELEGSVAIIVTHDPEDAALLGAKRIQLLTSCS